ncbi:MAG: 4Fe-4S binding protein [Myxococcales bacterium]
METTHGAPEHFHARARGAPAGYQAFIRREVTRKAMARSIIEIDLDLCDGCGVCVPACSQSALRIEDGKARVLSTEGCEGLEGCVGACPHGALRLVQRPCAPGALPAKAQTR